MDRLRQRWQARGSGPATDKRIVRWLWLAFATVVLALLIDQPLLAGLGLLLGLGSIAAWLGLRFALQYAAEEAELGKAEVGMELGAHALIVLGGLAVIAGLGALIRPDVRAQQRSAAAADPAARRVSAV